MDYFEIKYDKSIIKEFRIPERFELSINCVKVDGTDNNWLIKCDDNEIGFLKCVYNGPIIELLNKSADSQQWITVCSVNLSGILSHYHKSIIEMRNCYWFCKSGIVIMYFTFFDWNYLIRFDSHKTKLTHAEKFSENSIFFHPSNIESVGVDCVVEPGKKIFVLIINEITDEQQFLCPTIAGLQTILDRGIVDGLLNLFDFWRIRYTEIADVLSNDESSSMPLTFCFNGTPVCKFLGFLYIHQLVLVDMILEYCENDAISSSMANRFLEQLTNLINEYVSDVLTILFRIVKTLNIDLFNLKEKCEVISKTIEMLCETSLSCRKLILSSRRSLKQFKSYIPQKSIKSMTDDVTDNFRTIFTRNREESIKESLALGNIAELIKQFESTRTDVPTKVEFIEKAKEMIIQSIRSCGWNDLRERILKLGFEPTITLTTLCLDTNDTQIRDYLFDRLDLAKDYSSQKATVDRLRSAHQFHQVKMNSKSTVFHIFSTETGVEATVNSNQLRLFVESLAENSCAIEKPVSVSISNGQVEFLQTMNLRLKWIIDQDSLDKQNVKEIVDLCLIDADYRQILLSSENSWPLPEEQLTLWLSKWRHESNTLVDYIINSNDVDLITFVLNADDPYNLISDQIIQRLLCFLSPEGEIVNSSTAFKIIGSQLTNSPTKVFHTLKEMYSNDLHEAMDKISYASIISPIHFSCKNKECCFSSETIPSNLLNCIVDRNIDEILKSQSDAEFPLTLHFILETTGCNPDKINSALERNVEKVLLLNSAVRTDNKVDLLRSILPYDISKLSDKEYSMVQCDEIVYAALFAGITYDEIMESSDQFVRKIKNILATSKYWDNLRNRLIRPRNVNDTSTNIEEYYEVNLYSFLKRSGIPLSLETMFSWQQTNNFPDKSNTLSQFPDLNFIQKKHSSLFYSKCSLDYVYYLALGRPYQALVSIINEFSISGKPFCIPCDTIKDINISIYQIAFSNIDCPFVVGASFALLRLIGSSTEPLKCYLTLIEWIIEWHVNSFQQNDNFESSESQVISDIRHYFAKKTTSIFKICLSKSCSDKRIYREQILRQLEEIFISRLNSGYYIEIDDIFTAWSLVLYFCQLNSLPISTVLLQYFARQNKWLLFICVAQIFGYQKEQVKQGLNHFEDVCVRQHINYVISKADTCDFSSTSNILESSRSKRQTSISSKGAKPVRKSISPAAISDGNSTPGSSKRADSFHKQPQISNYSLKSLSKCAAKSLVELLFDCQIDPLSVNKQANDRISLDSVKLSGGKLLAYALALGNPFLTVIAYCTYDEGNSDEFKDRIGMSAYLNCLSCFIISSFPRKLQEKFWVIWNGFAKIEWTENEVNELILLAIENQMSYAVADAFSVLKPEKFDFIVSYFSMIKSVVDDWNPIQRDLSLNRFLQECKSHCLSDSDFLENKQRKSKSNKNTMLSFLSHILNSSLLTALTSVSTIRGARLLMQWILILSSTDGISQVYVKQLCPLNDINVSLLRKVLIVYFDYLDLFSELITGDFMNRTIPVNIRSKEFVDFAEQLLVHIANGISKLSEFTKQKMLSNIPSMITSMNQANLQVTPHDKWNKLLSTIRTNMENVYKTEVIEKNIPEDFLMIALIGQEDKEEIVNICKQNIGQQNRNEGVQSAKITYGTSDSWRRLVIPEAWQDELFNLLAPLPSDGGRLDQIAHVKCLLNEKKWIEACSFMIDNKVYVKDAILILVYMKVACDKMDPNKLPLSVKSVALQNESNRAVTRRASVIKLNLLNQSECSANGGKLSRNIQKPTDIVQRFLTNLTEMIVHGQEIVDSICSIFCVANKMTESYLTVANGEEFDVLSKILIGSCRDKIDTADMYLNVVNIDTQKLSIFLSEVIVQVLRQELQTHIASVVPTRPTFSVGSLKSSDDKGSLDHLKRELCSSSPKSGDSQKSLSPFLSSTILSSKRDVLQHSFLAENVLKVAKRCQLRCDWNPTLQNKLVSEPRQMKVFGLQELINLAPCHRTLGKLLFESYQQYSQEILSCKEDAEFLVNLLIQCHNCFTKSGDTIGISHCLKSAKELWRHLNSSSYFILMAQMLCRIGRYGEMPYIFNSLIESHQFELLLRKDMDREGVIVPYILDYLNRYFGNDFEKIEMVCHKYNRYFELAETQTKRAASSISKLKNLFGSNSNKDRLKGTLDAIISDLIDSCQNYLKVKCFKKVRENFRKAQFFKLQSRWLDDPDKTFATSKSSRLMSLRSILPETGLSHGVRIIDLNSDQAMVLLKRISCFYLAYVVIDQLRLSNDSWVDLFVHHVIVDGDDLYMEDYLIFFGPTFSPNFVVQVVNRLEKNFSKVLNKTSLTNLRLMLSKCPDVFVVKRISDKYQLK